MELVSPHANTVGEPTAANTSRCHSDAAANCGDILTTLCPILEQVADGGRLARWRYICTSINRGPGVATERLSSL